jgi:hypothetical protein
MQSIKGAKQFDSVKVFKKEGEKEVHESSLTY